MAKSAKKQKEKKPTQEDEPNTPMDSNSNQTSSSTNPSSNLFNSLFGVIPEENATVSIFSENNPFKRKPNDSYLSPPDREEVESGAEINAKRVVGLESSELKKRKKERNWDSDEEIKISVEKKSKSDQFGDFDVKKEEKKKKRKRDEVEAGYEAKKYGVMEQKEVKGDEGGVVGRKRKEMEGVEDIMVSKEGFDDESKLLRTVFVGNLPLKIKKKLLVKEFGKFGEVESLRIRSVPITDSKTPRKGAILKKQINEAADSVHTYVVFKTEESAQASLAHNMAVVGGNHIRVDRACPPRKKLKGDDDSPLYDNRRTVFVGNVPFDVKDEELYQLFTSIKDLESSIEAIRVIRDPGTSLGKGIAYVLFKTREAAALAARKHNLKIRNRELRLAHAKANATPSKRKTPTQPETNKSPAKKFAVTPGFRDQENSVKSKTSTSYQGLRASKSGIPKKTYSKKDRAPQNDVAKPKERLQKRPSVAARKAKAVRAAEFGMKRKPENQTPDSNSRMKKARKFT